MHLLAGGVAGWDTHQEGSPALCNLSLLQGSKVTADRAAQQREEVMAAGSAVARSRGGHEGEAEAAGRSCVADPGWLCAPWCWNADWAPARGC